MKIELDIQNGIAYVKVGEGKFKRSSIDWEAQGIIVDYDEDGKLIGFEFLGVRDYIFHPFEPERDRIPKDGG